MSDGIVFLIGCLLIGVGLAVWRVRGRIARWVNRWAGVLGGESTEPLIGAMGIFAVLLGTYWLGWVLVRS